MIRPASRATVVAVPLLLVLALMPVQTTLLGAESLCPQPQAEPVDVYRAFWDSGLSPADPHVECFMSRESLAELEAMRAADPEMVEAMLEFLTAMHVELNEAAEMGEVEVLEQTQDRATLRFGFVGRTGPLSDHFGNPVATVEMVREDQVWRIDRQAFESGSGSPFGP
jgi:hypothetical protein